MKKDRLSIHELVDRIIKDTGADKQLAENMLKALPAVITDGLMADGYVKVKGLGTFRLKWVKERSGRNMQTGEKMKIPAHSKVVFSPESSMKEAVNKEYKFLTYKVLNKDKGASYGKPTSKVFDKSSSDVVKEEKPSASVEKKEVDAGKPDKEKPIPSPLPPEPKLPEEQEYEYRPRNNYLWLIPITIILVLLLLAIFYYRTCNQDAGQADEMKKSEPEQVISPAQDDAGEQVIKPLEDSVAEEIADDPAIVQEEASIPEKVQPSAAKEPYQVVTTYTMDADDYLFQLARDHYKQPLYWVLIYNANRDQINNPEGALSGLTLTIPAIEGKPGALTKRDSLSLVAGYEAVYEYYKSVGDLERAAEFKYGANRYRP